MEDLGISLQGQGNLVAGYFDGFIQIFGWAYSLVCGSVTELRCDLAVPVWRTRQCPRNAF